VYLKMLSERIPRNLSNRKKIPVSGAAGRVKSVLPEPEMKVGGLSVEKKEMGPAPAVRRSDSLPDCPSLRKLRNSRSRIAFSICRGGPGLQQGAWVGAENVVNMPVAPLLPREMACEPSPEPLFCRSDIEIKALVKRHVSQRGNRYSHIVENFQYKHIGGHGFSPGDSTACSTGKEGSQI